MKNSKRSSVPMQEKLDYRKSQGENTPSEVKCMQRVPYASAIGSIMYEIWFLFMRKEPEIKLKVTCYTDAEVEYIDAAEASMEVVWMKKFINGLGDVMPSNKRPMEMLCDNAPAIAIANDPKIMRGAIHYQRKYHYIHEVIRDGEIVLKKVHTYDNLVDPFTIKRRSTATHVPVTGAAKRWVDRLTPGAVNTWDLLKKAFIQRYCPPSKTAKRLEYIHNFKQESDESLYQDWERYNDLLYKCPTHDINSHQKGPIPRMTPTQALIAIQTMVDHSQKWHDGTSSRNISSNSNTDGLAVIISKLDNLGRDMKELKENVHAIQVGCQICEGPHLDKECPLNEEVKQVEEVKYGEFGLPAPLYGSNGAKFRIKKLQENAEINTRNQSASLKNLETQIEQLTKELHSRTTNKAPSSSTRRSKVVNTDHETPHRPISSSKLNNLHGVSDFRGAQNEEERTTKVLQCQLPPKELNPGNFTLPCTIGNFNFYGMANLGASVNVIPKNIFEYLRLANLRNTNMLVEIVDMTKKAPLGIIENILVRIDKFLFPSDFVIIDKTPNETIILGMPFLATIHAKINVFDKEISLGIDNDRVSYDMEKKDHNFITSTEKFFMIKSNLDNRPQSPACSNNQSRKLRDRLPNDSLHDQGSKKKKIKLYQHTPRAHFCKPIKQTVNEKTKMSPTYDPTKSICDGGEGIYEYQTDSLVWDDRYVEWCNVSPAPGTSSQESNNPRPKDYTFKEWTLIKVGHAEINSTYWWHDHRLEQEEPDEMGIEIETYDPPNVQVETFEVKKYSFKGGQSFVCVTKEVDDALPLERKNILRFREIIRKEIDVDAKTKVEWA
ncbi:reverse transcriptase domain-containing protein [Tanacetum coccineum]